MKQPTHCVEYVAGAVSDQTTRVHTLSAFGNAEREVLRKALNAFPRRKALHCREVIAFRSEAIPRVVAILAGIEERSEPCTVTLISPFFRSIGLDHGKGRYAPFGEFTFDLTPQKSAHSAKFGRILDLMATLPALLLWVPFHLLACAAIKLTSRGDAVYRSQRIGYKEKPFTILKYRSMSSATDDQAHRDYLNKLYDQQNISALDGDGHADQFLKLTDDSRVTLVGAWMRKLSIDEVPQLWNVLEGEMSLIGPRPCLQYELERMSGWQKKRFEAIPGVSGMWQVYGRSRCSIEQSQFLDSLFVYARSPRLYLNLLFRTPLAVLAGKGAC